MLFNSSIFLFIFLPILLAVYFIAKNKYRNIILLISSLVFYAWGEKEIVLIMIASTIADYCYGIMIDKGRRRLGLSLSIITNLSFLGIFKYADFAFENYNTFLNLLGVSNKYLLELPHIALPIGISFYTFQTLSYTIDVYRNKVKANYNFIEFATYVTLFPQLIAGPIVRYESVYKQLKERFVTSEKFADGIERFIIGISKKMIFANTFGFLADEIFSYPAEALATSTIWLGVIAYSLQIYFDFSAYSDMAIGLGKMFGFDIPENFNYPYISRSIKDFWRRWHISLSTWFRDYLYIPLGGNRGSQFRTYLNLIIVFLVTGLWHGASWNFIVWGLWHGAFLIIERLGLDKILKLLWRPLQHLYTLLVVVVGWALFRIEDLGVAIKVIKNMFFINENALLFPDVYLTFEVYITFALGFIFSLPIYHFYKKQVENYPVWSKIHFYGFSVFLIFLFYISICLVSAGTYNPFIYFRF